MYTKKIIPIAFLLTLILTACGPTQSDLDAANARATQAERLAAVQAERASEANRRADEYWWQARWSAATSPERLGVVAMAIGLLGGCGVVCYGMFSLVIDGPSRRAHELDLRNARTREMEAQANLLRTQLAAQYIQIRQGQASEALVPPAQTQWDQLVAKYGPKQLPAGRQ